MKKRIMSLMLIFALVIGTITGFSVPEQSRAAETVTYEKKSITAFLFDKEKTRAMDVLIRSDLPEVPYICVEDYLDIVYKVDFTVKKTGEGKYSVQTGTSSHTMDIDTKLDTIYLASAMEFINAFPSNQEGNDYMFDLLYKNNEAAKSVFAAAVTLDMSKYQIDIAEMDGKVYLPVTTLSDLFIITYNSALYLGGNLYFVHATDVMNMSPDSPLYFDEEYKSLYDTTENSAALASFKYRELCFFVDHIYGRPAKAASSEMLAGSTFDQMIDSLEAETPGLKAALQSTDKVENFKALMALASVFFDGGHTILGIPLLTVASTCRDLALSQKLYTFLSKEPDLQDKLSLDASMNLFMMQSFNRAAGLTEVREQAFKKYKILKEWNGGTEALLNEKPGCVLLAEDDTAMFCFDYFDKEAIYAFKDALDIAKKKKMRRFIIDMGNNGGGLDTTVFYIMTILNNSINNANTNTFVSYTKDAISGSVMRSAIDLDLNLDGKYDDEDKKVRYDFDFAMLTSEYAFSSANMLPCFGKDFGVSVIGEKSSGGTCVLSPQIMADGSFNLMSGPLTILHEDGETNMDSGAPVDVDLVMKDSYGKADYSLFYDLDALGRAVDDPSIKLQKMTVKAGTKKVKAKQLKKKKITIKKALKIKKSKGKLSYSLVKGSSKKLSINKKGNITIKKGKYKKNSKLTAIVKVRAEGNKSYLPAIQTVVLNIKIK